MPWDLSESRRESCRDSPVQYLREQIRQGARSFSEPAKIFEALIERGRIRRGGHPVLRRCISNVAAKEDRKANTFPYKQHAKKRVDGVITSIIVPSRLIIGGAQPSSIFEERGIHAIAGRFRNKLMPALICTATSQIRPRSRQLAALSNRVSRQLDNSLASLLGYREAL